MQRPGGGLRQERCRDQQAYRQQHQGGGHVVLHFRFHLCTDRLGLTAEQPQQHRQRCQCAQLYAPENARTALHPEELEEVHVRKAAQQDAGGIAHQRGCALQVGGDRNGNNHRGHHEHGSHIVHKSTDDTGEQRQHTHRPLDIRHPDDEHFRQTGGHFALDEQRHRPHGARHHQQNVVIHRLQCRAERKAVYPGLAQHNKEHRTAQCHPRAVLLQPQHQQIGGCKQKQRKCHSRFSLLRVSLSSSIMR